MNDHLSPEQQRLVNEPLSEPPARAREHRQAWPSAWKARLLPWQG